MSFESPSPILGLLVIGLFVVILTGLLGLRGRHLSPLVVLSLGASIAVLLGLVVLFVFTMATARNPSRTAVLSATSDKATESPPVALISTSQTGNSENRSVVVSTGDSAGKKTPSRGIAVNVEIPEGASEESRAKAANLLQALSRAVSETVQDDLRRRFEAARRQTVETLALVTDAKPKKAVVPRPDWVESPAQWVGQTYQMPITIGPYATRPECDAKTPDELTRAVEDYVAMILNPETELKPNLPADFLEEKIVKQRFEETIQSSVGPMIQRHLLLEFDRSVRDRLEKLLSTAVVHKRLVQLGIGFASLFATLMIAWACLRISLAKSSRPETSG